jgi:hypothetical protein
MELDDLLDGGNPTMALRAAEGLLDTIRTDPESRKLAWSLFVELASQEAFTENARRHWQDCAGCAWCRLGVPEPFTMTGPATAETTSSLRSEG